MAKTNYLEAKPIKISKSIFDFYQYVEMDLSKSSGIMMEDGRHEFVFVKQDNVWLKIGSQPLVILPQSFSLSKMKSPYKLRCSGEINYFSVKLRPWMARHFFPSDSVNQLINLTSLFGSKIETLRADIFASTLFGKMVETVETFFSDVEMPNPDSYKLIIKICRKIYLSKGMISVKELMNEFSESRQKINHDFLFHTKYTVKEFVTFVKIREAIKFKSKNPNISLTELAYQFGYFDQSHFIRDIKKVTGATPTLLFSNENFLKEQLRKIQP